MFDSYAGEGEYNSGVGSFPDSLSVALNLSNAAVDSGDNLEGRFSAMQDNVYLC